MTDNLPNLPPDPDDDPRTRRVEQVISSALRIGVYTSLLLIVAGTVLSFCRSPEFHDGTILRLSYDHDAIPLTWGRFKDDLYGFKGPSLVVLGLLLLIATPVMRVTISIFAFARQRDWKFAIITTGVLLLLLVSFAIKNLG